MSARLWSFFFGGSKLVRFWAENAFSNLLSDQAKSSKDGIKDFFQYCQLDCSFYFGGVESGEVINGLEGF